MGKLEGLSGVTSSHDGTPYHPACHILSYHNCKFQDESLNDVQSILAIFSLHKWNDNGTYMLLRLAKV